MNKIPKRIFFYWDNNNMSWMRYMTLYSFRKLNPDWEMILYLSELKINNKKWNGFEEQDFSNYKGENYLDKINDLNIEIKEVELPKFLTDNIKMISPVHESDLFRYYELYRNGGFYSDMDILYFKPIDELYNDVLNNNSDVLLFQCNNYVAIGFLGSIKNNEYFRDLLNLAKRVGNKIGNDYQAFGVDLMYKMFNQNRQSPIILNKIQNEYKYKKFYNLSQNCFYYYDWTKINENYNNSYGLNNFPNDAIGYHWFGGSKISQKFNNILNENNYKDYKITFSELCKNIL